MGTKFGLLIAIVVVFIGLSSAELKQLRKCHSDHRNECLGCNFLTFEYFDIGGGLEVIYSCPQESEEEKYCCYGPLRDPFCCDIVNHIINGVIWLIVIVALILIIAVIQNFIMNRLICFD